MQVRKEKRRKKEKENSAINGTWCQEYLKWLHCFLIRYHLNLSTVRMYFFLSHLFSIMSCAICCYLIK